MTKESTIKLAASIIAESTICADRRRLNGTKLCRPGGCKWCLPPTSEDD